MRKKSKESDSKSKSKLDYLLIYDLWLLIEIGAIVLIFGGIVLFSPNPKIPANWIYGLSILAFGVAIMSFGGDMMTSRNAKMDKDEIMESLREIKASIQEGNDEVWKSK